MCACVQAMRFDLATEDELSHLAASQQSLFDSVVAFNSKPREPLVKPDDPATDAQLQGHAAKPSTEPEAASTARAMPPLAEVAAEPTTGAADTTQPQQPPQHHEEALPERITATSHACTTPPLSTAATTTTSSE